MSTHIDHSQVVDAARKMLLIRAAGLWYSFKETAYQRIHDSRLVCKNSRHLLGVRHSDTIKTLSMLLGVSSTDAEAAVGDAMYPSSQSIALNTIDEYAEAAEVRQNKQGARR